MTGSDEYLSTQVLTASPYRLHLMVVEGAIRFGTLGAEAIASDDVETIHSALSRSRDFVAELIGGVSDKHDETLSKRMKQLFFFAYINLVEGERERDLRKVQDAINILQRHHETWVELGMVLKPGTPSQPKSQSPPPPHTSIAGANPSRAWSA